ncbi:hypothetical protein G9466_19055 [Halorussus sp. JP-T4]|nr:hypothetical protein [Halorussus sp. JP-T4]NHN61162.1 hypothetical protein [Halorussus sp. JP-T4]
MGVEFGELADRIDGHDYPATTGEIADAYGEYEVEYAGGSESLAALLGPIDDTCDSPAAVRQAVLNAVGGGAVGRRGYTDRGSFASTPSDVSF